MNYQEEKLRKQFNLHLCQKSKVPRYKLNQGLEIPLY